MKEPALRTHIERYLMKRICEDTIAGLDRVEAYCSWSAQDFKRISAVRQMLCDKVHDIEHDMEGEE